jgi:hypothetical protein
VAARGRLKRIEERTDLPQVAHPKIVSWLVSGRREALQGHRAGRRRRGTVTGYRYFYLTWLTIMDSAWA